MTNTQHTNENLTFYFKVKDFNAWRTGYNGNEKGRVSAGMTNGYSAAPMTRMKW